MTYFLREPAKTRGLTTPSQGARLIPLKHRIPLRSVDGAGCPRCFRPVRTLPLASREEFGLVREAALSARSPTEGRLLCAGKEAA